MTEETLPILFDAPHDMELKHVSIHEIKAYEAEGWRVCEGWQNAGHHLRYSIMMEREIPA